MSTPWKRSPLFTALPDDPGRYRFQFPLEEIHSPHTLDVWWHRGKILHPVVAVTAMVHGDEFEGFAAAQRFWKAIARRRIQGSVLVLPICNPFAASTTSRCSPDIIDGKNLARTFPGSATGTPTEQLAHIIWNLVEPADILVDLHSGGTGYDYAALSGFYREQDQALAACFSFPYRWKLPANPGVLSYELARRKKRAIGHEYGGEARLDPSGEQAYYEGLLRLLHHLDMISSAPPSPPAPRTRVLKTTRYQYATEDGWFLSRVSVGQSVHRGRILGTWIDGKLESHPLRSRFRGTVIGLRTLPRVQKNDYLVVFGR